MFVIPTHEHSAPANPGWRDPPVKLATLVVVDSAADEREKHRARLCHVRSWNDGRGFGFSMQAERGRHGQYVGNVEPGSPAEAAGLRDGDRIVEVNDSNIDDDTHKQVAKQSVVDLRRGCENALMSIYVTFYVFNFLGRNRRIAELRRCCLLLQTE